jgi:hypothetical protein
MQLNRFIWDLYRDSKDGKAAIERNLSEHIKSDPANWFSKAFIHNIYYCEIANGEVVENEVFWRCSGDSLLNSDLFVSARMGIVLPPEN